MRLVLHQACASCTILTIVSLYVHGVWCEKEWDLGLDRFEILREISEWESEIDRIESSDEDESEQIREIEERIKLLKDSLEDA